MKIKEPFETYSETYTIIDTPVEGGTGFVYKVNSSSGESFALKLLKPEQIRKDRVSRFHQEISFCKTFNHQNILKVLDNGFVICKDQKCPFYVMKYYPQMLRSAFPIRDPKMILLYFSKILDGVEALHLNKCWHRDLKPENILLDAPSNELVIADFGIAHFSEELLHTAIETKQNDKLCNNLYAAPEQRIRGRRIDHRADIFTLGKILNEMFTGNVPEGNDYAEIGGTNANYAFLDKIIHRMLQNNPDSRHQSIKEIKYDLLAQENEFISLQKIHQLNKKVIPNIEIDDPFISNPVELVDCDPDPLHERLILILNQAAANNDLWYSIYVQHPEVIGSQRMGLGFQWITDDKLSRPLYRDLNIQAVIDSFKHMLKEINEEYLQYLQKNAKEQEEALKEDLRRKLHAEGEKQRLRRSFKI